MDGRLIETVDESLAAKFGDLSAHWVRRALDTTKSPFLQSCAVVWAVQFAKLAGHYGNRQWLSGHILHGRFWV